MSAPIAEILRDMAVPPVIYQGRLQIDDDGYSMVNEEGVITAYFSKEICNWDMDIRNFDGVCIELAHFPHGQLMICGVNSAKKGGDDVST